MLTASATPARYFRSDMIPKQIYPFHLVSNARRAGRGPVSRVRRRGDFSVRSRRRVCRRVGSRRAEAQRNRSPRCLRGTKPHVPNLPESPHDIAWAADPLFAAEPELHLALEHPHDLLICVTVRLHMDARPYAPPDDHPLVAGENASADFFADLLLK